MAKVLVTSSAGFIGMHVALRLAEEGHEVVGIDNLNTYYSVDLNPQNRESKHYIYNIGRGKPIKLMDFIHELEEVIGKKAKKNFLPMQAGDCHQTWADTSKLAADTGYAPKVNLEQGVKSFVDWYLNYYLE